MNGVVVLALATYIIPVQQTRHPVMPFSTILMFTITDQARNSPNGQPSSKTLNAEEEQLSGRARDVHIEWTAPEPVVYFNIHNIKPKKKYLAPRYKLYLQPPTAARAHQGTHFKNHPLSLLAPRASRLNILPQVVLMICGMILCLWQSEETRGNVLQEFLAFSWKMCDSSPCV